MPPCLPPKTGGCLPSCMFHFSAPTLSCWGRVEGRTWNPRLFLFPLEPYLPPCHFCILLITYLIMPACLPWAVSFMDRWNTIALLLGVHTIVCAELRTFSAFPLGLGVWMPSSACWEQSISHPTWVEHCLPPACTAFPATWEAAHLPCHCMPQEHLEAGGNTYSLPCMHPLLGGLGGLGLCQHPACRLL